MSQSAISIFNLSCIAPTAVAQYRGVDFNDAQIVTAGAKIKGIAKRPAAAGEPFEAAVCGTATCEAGGAIAKGAPVTMDAQGRVVTAASLAIAAGATAVTSAAANGATDLTGGVLPQFVLGDALEAAAGAGSFIEVLLSR